jgi:uncharacterized membrane protein
MLPTSSQIRAAARQSLRGNWLPAIGITLLMIVIMGILSYIPFIGGICALLLAGPLTIGLYAFFLNLVRAEKAEVGMLFGEFQNYGEKLLLTILIAVFTFLWTLLLIIPGIIAAYRYSQAYFIMKDNPGISAMDAIRLSKEMMAGHTACLSSICRLSAGRFWPPSRLDSVLYGFTRICWRRSPYSTRI